MIPRKSQAAQLLESVRNFEFAVGKKEHVYYLEALEYNYDHNTEDLWAGIDQFLDKFFPANKQALDSSAAKLLPVRQRKWRI